MIHQDSRKPRPNFMEKTIMQIYAFYYLIKTLGFPYLTCAHKFYYDSVHIHLCTYVVCACICASACVPIIDIFTLWKLFCLSLYVWHTPHDIAIYLYMLSDEIVSVYWMYEPLVPYLVSFLCGFGCFVRFHPCITKNIV